MSFAEKEKEVYSDMTYTEFFDITELAEEGRKSFCDLRDREKDASFSDSVRESFRQYEIGDEEFYKHLSDFARREKIEIEVLNLYLYLKKSFETYIGLANKGIDGKILADTYKEFSKVSEDNKKKTDIYGIPQEIQRRWLRRYVNGTIFRIGRLNFDIAKSDRDYEIDGYTLKKDEDCISVHIPDGGRLFDGECENSYAEARSVFGKIFGMNPCFFVCYSWLLSPWLSEVLPRESLIVKFQSRYKIVAFDESAGDMLTHIYPVTYEEVKTKPIEEYSEDTTLRRMTKERMKRGEIIGYGTGIRL